MYEIVISVKIAAEIVILLLICTTVAELYEFALTLHSIFMPSCAVTKPAVFFLVYTKHDPLPVALTVTK